MMNEFEQYDLAALQGLYMEESKSFSIALTRGASWQELSEKRIRIREISACIHVKYTQGLNKPGRRRDNLPPDSADE